MLWRPRKWHLERRSTADGFASIIPLRSVPIRLPLGFTLEDQHPVDIVAHVGHVRQTGSATHGRVLVLLRIRLVATTDDDDDHDGALETVSDWV